MVDPPALAGPPAVAILPCRRVLRAVVLAAEQDGQEMCEELMELYSSCLLAQPGSAVTASISGHSGSSGSESGQNGSSELERGSGSGGLCLAPPAQPGFMYKIYAYAPAGEGLAATVQRLGDLEHQALQRCRSRSRQQQQEQQQAVPVDADADADADENQQQPLPVTAGDGRHGLLALHLSRNLFEGGTGCHEWQAGFFLAEWVLSHPGLVTGGWVGGWVGGRAVKVEMRCWEWG